MSQNASAALKYMSGVDAEPRPESRSFVARKCHVAAAVATHRGELEERRDRRDVSLEDDLTARDRGVEAFGYRGHSPS